MTHRALLASIACSAAVLIGGWLAWTSHLRAVAALLDARAASAQMLLAAGQRPGRVIQLIGGGEVVVVPGRPRRAPPPLGGRPPPPIMQQPPPLRAAARQRPHGWFPFMIADLAHIRPRSVTRDGIVVITVLPSPRELAAWFLLDTSICAGLIALVVLVAWRVRRTQRLAEERLLAQREAAAAEQRRFLADAGHELRTPLTILSGYIDVLGGSERNESDAHVLDGMRKAAARMRGLVEKLLLLSRLESSDGGSAIVSVAAVSNEVAEDMRAQVPGREIVVRCDPLARIRIAEDDFYEAERNLVENALYYAPESPVEIAASVRGGVAEIVVGDRGPGIPLDEQRLVFERFYRGRDRTGVGGTGLGLAIVRRVVERWNGDVELESSGAGTRVTLRFPIAQEKT